LDFIRRAGYDFRGILPMGHDRHTGGVMEETFKEFRKGVAERLRGARGELTQAQLAEITKYTQQMISRYESGRVPKAFWFLAELSADAGLDVNYVLTGRRRRKPAATKLSKSDAPKR
jgi:predicted transcriptional regulator